MLLALLNKADVLITNTISKINYELLNLYWKIGKMIVEYKEENNSQYGDTVVNQFSTELRIRYDKGFEKRNIFRMIQFYEIFSKVSTSTQFNNKINSKVGV